jgi:hypothetical protein
MLKFFVLVFVFTNQPNIRVVGNVEVKTLEECTQRVLEINTSPETPYNAACVLIKDEDA